MNVEVAFLADDAILCLFVCVLDVLYVPMRVCTCVCCGWLIRCTVLNFVWFCAVGVVCQPVFVCVAVFVSCVCFPAVLNVCFQPAFSASWAGETWRLQA